MGVLGNQIGPWKVLKKSGNTFRQTSANYYIDSGVIQGGESCTYASEML